MPCARVMSGWGGLDDQRRFAREGTVQIIQSVSGIDPGKRVAAACTGRKAGARPRRAASSDSRYR